MMQWHEESDYRKGYEGEWVDELPPHIGQLQPTWTTTPPPITEYIGRSTEGDFYSVHWDCIRNLYRYACVSYAYAEDRLQPTLEFRRVQHFLQLYEPDSAEKWQSRRRGEPDQPANPTSSREAGNGDLLTRQEAARKSGFSMSKIDRLLREGKLRKLQPGGKRTAVRIDAKELLPSCVQLDESPPTAPPAEPPSAPEKLSGPSPKWKRNAAS